MYTESINQNLFTFFLFYSELNLRELNDIGIGTLA